MHWRLLAICSSENRDLITSAMAHWSVDVGWFHCLADAKHSLRRRKHPLVLCEAELPDGTYHDVCRLLGSRLNETKVIVISGADLDECHAEATRIGAFDVIASPCSRTDLQWILMRAVQSCPKVKTLPKAGQNPETTDEESTPKDAIA